MTVLTAGERSAVSPLRVAWQGGAAGVPLAGWDVAMLSMSGRKNRQLKGDLTLKVFCCGAARIRNKLTGAVFDIQAKELDWQEVSADERQMGPEICHQAEFEHPELGTLSWSLWEYPQGMENDRETDVGGHELLSDIDYGLEPEREPDEWIDYSLPESPFNIFMDSYHRTGDLLAEHGSSDGRSLFNRMVFSHQVTALEAYLGDTLIKAVLADKATMARLMTVDKELAQRKFTLTEISADPELVTKTVREYLRSILYHNLAKVDFLYRAALQFPILDIPQDTQRLFKAIHYRHDCVHRNGFDVDGIELTVFTKDYVQDVSDRLKALVEGIEPRLRQY